MAYHKGKFYFGKANEISLPLLESSQIHLHHFRLVKILLLLLFSLNLSQNLIIIFQVDFLSSAKA